MPDSTANDRPGRIPGQLVRRRHAAARAVSAARRARRRPMSAWSAAAIPGSRRRCTWRRPGFDVVLLEASRVGCGASGRNGGQVGSGQRRDQAWLERRWRGRRARARSGTWPRRRRRWSASLVARHGIACDLRAGILHAAHRPADVPALPRRGREARPRLWLRPVEPLDRAGLRGARSAATPITAARSTAAARTCIRSPTRSASRGPPPRRACAIHERSRRRRARGPRCAPTAGAVRARFVAASPATAISAASCRRSRRG